MKHTSRTKTEYTTIDIEGTSDFLVVSDISIADTDTIPMNENYGDDSDDEEDAKSLLSETGDHIELGFRRVSATIQASMDTMFVQQPASTANSTNEGETDSDNEDARSLLSEMGEGASDQI